jgi:DNA-binding HxlR family transcriptional regulator
LIVRDLAAGPRRFVELQRVLPGISTEQLRSRLNRMVADGMLTRKRYREVPPRVDYELTERARALMPILGELARWGYEWAWSPPRSNEAIDIGAIFRLAPGLVSTHGRGGVVELLVESDGESASYAITLADGTASIREHAPTSAEARVRGSSIAWISAFSPELDRHGLHITGDTSLAESVLDGLCDVAGRTNAGTASASYAA